MAIKVTHECKCKKSNIGSMKNLILAEISPLDPMPYSSIYFFVLASQGNFMDTERQCLLSSDLVLPLEVNTPCDS